MTNLQISDFDIPMTYIQTIEYKLLYITKRIIFIEENIQTLELISEYNTKNEKFILKPYHSKYDKIPIINDVKYIVQSYIDPFEDLFC
jgi:hypothetical protein